ERMIWEPPVVAVRPTEAVGGVIVNVAQSQDFLDKPWLYVDQTTGTLYLTYTRFALDGETPLELVRCNGCALKSSFTNADWAGTSGLSAGDRTETQQRIGYAYSDDDGKTWSGDKTIAVVNPQSEPPGYNRGRTSGIANVPSIAVDKGADDGVFTSGELSQTGF